ncbi:MAG: hypothetical protein AAF937_03675 [Planctomycetota bacterium]
MRSTHRHVFALWQSISALLIVVALPVAVFAVAVLLLMVIEDLFGVVADGIRVSVATVVPLVAVMLKADLSEQARERDRVRAAKERHLEQIVMGITQIARDGQVTDGMRRALVQIAMHTSSDEMEEVLDEIREMVTARRKTQDPEAYPDADTGTERQNVFDRAARIVNLARIALGLPEESVESLKRVLSRAILT